MANRSGVAGVVSGWEDGALVFRVRSTGEELLRIAPGGVTTGGLAITGGPGEIGEVLTSNGDGTASFAPPAA